MKKNIGTLIPQFDKALTGGQKYDFYFVEQLFKLNQHITLLTDDKLKFTFIKQSLIYNLIYLLNFSLFRNIDILIINSRLYPRLQFFIPLLKLFNKRIKIIAIHHHYNYMTQDGIKKKIHKYMELSFLKKCNSLIIPSLYCKKETENIFPNKKIHFLEIAFPEKEIEVNMSQKIKNQFLYIGSIEPRKGIEYLIKSLYLVLQQGNKFQMIIAGKYDTSNKYFKKIKKLIHSYKLDNYINFAGRISNKQLEVFKRTSSLFLFPSLHEGYGMVLAEVMYFGIPVVAFNNSAIPYIIKNNYNGFVVKNKDVKSFTQVITKLLNNEELLCLLRNNCYNTAKKLRTYNDLNRDIKNFVCQINKI